MLSRKYFRLGVYIVLSTATLLALLLLTKSPETESIRPQGSSCRIPNEG